MLYSHLWVALVKCFVPILLTSAQLARPEMFPKKERGFFWKHQATGSGRQN